MTESAVKKPSKRLIVFCDGTWVSRRLHIPHTFVAEAESSFVGRSRDHCGWCATKQHSHASRHGWGGPIWQPGPSREPRRGTFYHTSLCEHRCRLSRRDWSWCDLPRVHLEWCNCVLYRRGVCFRLPLHC